MQRKIKKKLYLKLIFGAYNVGRKIIHFDGSQYYFSSALQNYKIEVDFLRILSYEVAF